MEFQLKIRMKRKLYWNYTGSSAIFIYKDSKSVKRWSNLQYQNYEILTEVSNSCELCRKYKRAPSKSVIYLSVKHTLAFTFNVFFQNEYLHHQKPVFFHLVDHVTRNSAQVVIKSKMKEKLVEQLSKVWIKI